MLKTMISTQYLAGYSALLSVIASAGTYGWFTPIMDYLLDPESDMYMTSEQVAFVVAILAFGELAVCLPAGLIADKFGRKFCILITGPLFAISWIIILLWKSYIVLCVMRILLGIAMGGVFTAVPLYLGEISSPAQRGSITGLFSGAFFFGYLLQYCVGPFVSYTVFTILTASVPVVFTIIFFYQPESPYYLLTKGKEEEATTVLRWLRKGFSEDSIRCELEDMKETVKNELTIKPSWKDLIDTPADRRTLLIILLIGGTRILSGAPALMSYSTILFAESGSSFLSPDYLTIIMGFALLLGGIVNAFIVDSLGRRPLLFISCIGSFFSLFLVGTYLYIQKTFNVDVSPYSWTVPVGVIMYCLFSVVGIYPISMTYTSELFTTKTRGKAASLSTINLSIGSFICVEVYGIVGNNYGLCYVFWIYAVVILFGTTALFFLAPETKGKTFSEIRRDIFNVRDTKPISHNTDLKRSQSKISEGGEFV